MKSIGTAKEVNCTFTFYMIRPGGSVIVIYETNHKDGTRSLELRQPENAEEQKTILEAVQKSESARVLTKKKLDRTPKATTSDGSLFQ